MFYCRFLLLCFYLLYFCAASRVNATLPPRNAKSSDNLLHVDSAEQTAGSTRYKGRSTEGLEGFEPGDAAPAFRCKLWTECLFTVLLRTTRGARSSFTRSPINPPFWSVCGRGASPCQTCWNIFRPTLKSCCCPWMTLRCRTPSGWENRCTEPQLLGTDTNTDTSDTSLQLSFVLSKYHVLLWFWAT